MAGIFPQESLDNLDSAERINSRVKFFEEDQKRSSLVAIFGGEVVGFCDFGPSRRPKFGIGEIYSIYAKPDLKGMGIGKKLIEAAELILHEKELTPYIVTTLEENIPAQKFYEKLGFTEAGKIITQVWDEAYPEIVYFKDSEWKVRIAIEEDIQSIVQLSYKKRLDYEKAQPQFWRYAGTEAEKSQISWFKKLIERDDHIMLIAVRNAEISAFIIGSLIKSPEVYDPGGLTLMIDDFCVQHEHEWDISGMMLIDKIKYLARTKGATQILVVCGDHDKEKKRFLEKIDLTIASNWYVREI